MQNALVGTKGTRERLKKLKLNEPQSMPLSPKPLKKSRY